MKSLAFAFLLLFCWVSPLFSNDDLPRRDYWPTSEWRSSPPQKQGMDQKKLNEINAYIKENLSLTSSVLIVRHGYIVFERYYDDSPKNRRKMWSATKGVLSGLIGIAIQKGHLIGPDQRMMDFFPEFVNSQLNPEARKVTIRHLLTMSDGISHREMDYFFRRENLISGFRAAPGSESFYNSLSPQIISMILSKTTGSKAVDFARKHLFEPLGIFDVYWQDTGDYSRGAYGMSLTTRDIAKIGYLYLNMGTWNDKEIIPQDWIRESTKRQIVNHQFTEYYKDYGYYWWIHPMGNYHAYYAEGMGGQFIVICPEVDLVVVITSNDNTLDDEKYLLIISEKIVPSIRR